MQNYLQSCATTAIRSEENNRSEQTYREIMDVIYKFAR